MLKARGLCGFERLFDNAMEMSKYLTEKIEQRPGFRTIKKGGFDYTNICFWYIPKSLRNLEETPDWWQQLYKIAPLLKEKMIMKGTLMVGYSPLPNKSIGNFFRMVIACFPPAQTSDIDFVLDEIERLAYEL